MKHFKYDLYSDEQLSALSTKVGDVLELLVPEASGHFASGRHQVLAIEMTDAGEHQGKHYTRVGLELEGPITE
jgi:hypothetical protein